MKCRFGIEVKVLIMFVASHDFGDCFHAMEDVAIADGVPKFLKKSIILQIFGVKFRHPCQQVENVVIPPFISPESVKSTLQTIVVPEKSKRVIMVFFRGKIEVHPKNVSGRFTAIRTQICQKFNWNRKFYLKRHRFRGYQSEIVRSKFCLYPLGWAPWSPRLVESVALGCVPVIIADGIRLPIQGAVKLPKISLTVAEKDVRHLGKILQRVADTNISAIQRSLWDPSVRKALFFNSEI
ncbi:hypothetical protein MKX01_036206 [Papaver californicum]|nr:hypothetical protein MKX01_036206 [Papaver californicum]